MDYKQASKTTFDRQADAYDETRPGAHARALYPHMLQQIIHIYGREVLDLGCGTGALMEQVLLEDRTRRLTGLDLSANMLAQAAKRLGGKVRLVVGDSESLPFENDCFDLVYCNDSFHHYPTPTRALAEVKRVLKPGGVFLLGDCTAPGWQLAPLNLLLRFGGEGDVRIYSPKELAKLLGGFFKQVEWEKASRNSCIVKGVKA